MTQFCNELYLKVRISDDFDPNTDWLEDVVEIGTTDPETNYDNNLNRHVWKPEPTNYGAAVTSVDDKTMQLLSAGGFDWMIYYLNWSETEPQDNQYYWRDLDDAIWKAWWYNLKLIVRVDRAPAWARGPGTATAPPSDPAKLGEFLQEVASGGRFVNGRWSYVPKIAGYVIWNEPNLAAEWGGNAPDAAAYTALLQAAYNGVKAGDPNAWVISAGLAPTNENSATAVDDRIFLEDMLFNSACTYFDRLGVNPMGFASAPDDTSDPNDYNFSRALGWRQILVDNGCSKDMFATEMGWLRDTPIDLGGFNWMKVSDIDQAHYLARAYHKARREWPWMGPMMTWNLDFSTFYSDTEHFHWFSVTDDGLSPLRPYLTLKNAATGGPADLWVEKEVGSIRPDQTLDYVIHCTNIGGQPATGVALTDTLPSFTTYVTDSRGDGMLVGNEIVWNIGAIDTGARETITLTLHVSGAVPPTLLKNKAEANVMAAEPYIDDNVAMIGGGNETYLPIVLRDYTPPPPPPVAPDLVVENIIATSNAVTVTIRNQGTQSVPDAPAYEFWVDLYINPSHVPGYNETCQTMGCKGAAWGVTSSATALPTLLPIAPGEVVTLTTGGDYYWPSKETIDWPLSQGDAVYAQVDSANAATSYGSVLENHEITGGPYNNVSGQFTVQGLGAKSSPVLSPDEGPEQDISQTSLPLRP
jgi:uncharacterized repeat protein (TIGR01451 family)